MRKTKKVLGTVKKNTKKILSHILLLALIFGLMPNVPFLGIGMVAEAAAVNTTVQVGNEWLDTDGYPIQAHGGGFTQRTVDGVTTYYWVGENRLDDKSFVSVRLYSSTDLLNWEFMGDVITRQTPGEDPDTHLGVLYEGKTTIERPKIIWSPQYDADGDGEPDGRWIIYAHWEDGTSYGASHLLVAVSSDERPDSDYTVIHNKRPGWGFHPTEYTTDPWGGYGKVSYNDATYEYTRQFQEDPSCDCEGIGSLDFGIFQFPGDDNAYLVASTGWLDMRLYKLNDDFSWVDFDSSYYIFRNGLKEAPAMAMVPDENGEPIYFLAVSNQAGWFPNQMSYATTRDPMDPNGWSELREVTDPSSYYSQPTGTMAITAADGTSKYVYMGDRWTKYGDNITQSTYVWLPMEFDVSDPSDPKMDIKYVTDWRLDVANGRILLPEHENAALGKPVMVTPTDAGRIGDASWLTDGEVTTHKNGDPGAEEVIFRLSKAASFTVDLGEPRNVVRINNMFPNMPGSEPYFQYTVQASNDQKQWKMLVDKSGNTQTNFQSDVPSDTETEYRYWRINLTGAYTQNRNQWAMDWLGGMSEWELISPKKSAKDITSFKVNKVAGAITNIDEVTGKIDIVLPHGSIIPTRALPEIKHNGLSYEPLEPKDFTKPVEYVITAKDGSEKKYTVTTTVEPLAPFESVVDTELNDIIMFAPNSGYEFLPTEILSNLSDGTVAYLPVKWRLNGLDLTKPTVGEITGVIQRNEFNVKVIVLAEGEDPQSYISEIDGFTYGEPMYFAVYAGDPYESLPETLKATKANGERVDLPVEWSIDRNNYDSRFETPYASIGSVTAKAGGYNIKTVIEVVPEDIIFFADVNGLEKTPGPGSSLGFDSPVFPAINKLLAKDGKAPLLNDKPDQRYNEASGWGLAANGIDSYKVEGSPTKATYNKTKDANVYATNDSTQGLEYHAVLPQGTYTVTFGGQNFAWWGDKTYDVRYSVNGGTSWTTVERVTNKEEQSIVYSFDVTIADDDTEFALSLYNQGAILSWVGIAHKGAEVVNKTITLRSGQIPTERIAVYAGDTSKLPQTVQVDFFNGETTEEVTADVIYNPTALTNLATPYRFVTNLAGTATYTDPSDGKKYTIAVTIPQVEVVPESLVFFADINSQNNVVYNAISGLIGDNLVNKTADQPYNGTTNLWGWVGGTAANQPLQAGTYNKADSMRYSAKTAGSNIEYHARLDAGIYRATWASQTNWASANRTAMADYKVEAGENANTMTVTETLNGIAVYQYDHTGHLPATLPVKFPDNSTGTASVTWDVLRLDTPYAYVSDLSGVATAMYQDSEISVAVTYPHVEVVPEELVFFADLRSAATTTPWASIRALVGNDNLINDRSNAGYNNTANGVQSSTTWGISGNVGGYSSNGADTNKTNTFMYANTADKPAYYTIPLKDAGTYKITLAGKGAWSDNRLMTVGYSLDQAGTPEEKTYEAGVPEYQIKSGVAVQKDFTITVPEVNTTLTLKMNASTYEAQLASWIGVEKVDPNQQPIPKPEIPPVDESSEWTTVVSSYGMGGGNVTQNGFTFKVSEDNSDFTLRLTALQDNEVMFSWLAIEDLSLDYSQEEDIVVATYAGTLPELPQTIKMVKSGSADVNAPVTWTLNADSFTDAFSTVTVTGSVNVNGKQFTVFANVEVIPSRTVYWINAGAKNGSVYYDAVKALTGADKLINETADIGGSGSTAPKDADKNNGYVSNFTYNLDFGAPGLYKIYAKGTALKADGANLTAIGATGNYELLVTSTDGKVTVTGNSVYWLIATSHGPIPIDISFAATAQAFQVKGIDADDGNANNIKIRWNYLENAKSYKVYKDDTLLATTTSVLYDDYGVTAAAQYKVEAYDGVNGTGTMIDETRPVTGTPKSITGNLSIADNTAVMNFVHPDGVKVGDKYYRYINRASGSKIAIYEQSSSDGLTGWSTERLLLDSTKVPSLANSKLESGGVHYNEKTGKMVIWRHFEEAGSTYNTAAVIRFSGTPGGDDWSSTGAFRPQGRESRDMNFFVDNDGKAYIISATRNNSDLALYQLTEDWTDVAPVRDFAAIIISPDEHREAPSLVNIDGWYYLFSSNSAGWYPTESQYSRASSIEGLGTAKLIRFGNNSTFGAQSGGVSQVGTNGEYVMFPYRWAAQWSAKDPGTNNQNTPRFMPLAMHDGFVSMDYYPTVKYNASGDFIPVQDGKLVSLGKPANSKIDIFTQLDPSDAGISYGDPVVITDGISYLGDVWNTTFGLFRPNTDTPYITIDLGEPTNITATDITFHTVNGSENYFLYEILGSVDGKTWTVLSDRTGDVPANRNGAFRHDRIDNDGGYRYVRLHITASLIWNNGTVGNSRTGDWVRGIYEFSVYGSDNVFEITATDDGHGKVNAASLYTAAGHNRTIEFIPNPGYDLATLTVDGASVDVAALGKNAAGNKTYTFTNIGANHTVAATFTGISAYKVIAQTNAASQISADETAQITLTVKDYTDNVYDGFNGVKKVALLGISHAPNGEYGKADGNDIVEGEFEVIFTNGVAQFNLQLFNATLAQPRFAVEDVSMASEQGQVRYTVTAGELDDLILTTPMSLPLRTSTNFVTASTPPMITLVDSYGNICRNGVSSNATVTAEFEYTPEDADVELKGPLTLNASSGVARFLGLQIKADQNINFTFTYKVGDHEVVDSGEYSDQPVYKLSFEPGALVWVAAYKDDTSRQVAINNASNRDLTIGLSLDSDLFTLDESEIEVAIGDTGTVTVRPVGQLDAGSYTAVLTAVSNPGGVSVSKEIIFVVMPVNMQSTVVNAIPDQHYIGEAIYPEITVSYTNADGTVELLKDGDYTIEYNNNDAIGVATIKLTGIGNYMGSKTLSFAITGSDVVVPPTTPANLTASSGNAVVNLSWSRVTEATYYSVKRSESAEGDYTTIAAQIVGTNYVDTSVMNGTTYYYVVTAGNSAGESDNSNVISATPAEKAAELKLTAAQGSVIGTTSVTTNVYQSDDTFKVKVYAPEDALPATPIMGEMPPADATAYRLESNIDKVSAGSTVALYELDANGHIVAYGKVELTKWDIRVSFPNNGGSNPSTTLPPVEPVEKENVLQVDADWAAESLADESQSALTIDLKDIAIGANGRKSAVLSAQVVKQVREAGKPIALKSEGAEWIIPLDAIESDEDITLSIGYASTSTGPANTQGKDLYSLTAFTGDKELTKIGATAVVKLPIPADVKDADKLAVYKKSADGTWEYAGGRAVDGKLSFVTDEFGEYLVAESTKTFADVRGHWAQRTVEVMVARQLVNGVSDDKFAPDSTVTRAEFAALITRILKLDGAEASFSDVASGVWYEKEIGAAAAAGIIVGDGDKFRPLDVVTRQEMAVMILRAYQVAGGQAGSAGTTPFTDAASISSWAEEAVAGVYSLGIIEGRPDGSFNPAGKATRAEGLTMLLRLMDKIGL